MLAVFGLPMVVVATVLVLFPCFVANFLRLSKFVSLYSTVLSEHGGRRGLEVLGSSRANTFTMVSLTYLFILGCSKMDALVGGGRLVLDLVFVPTVSEDFVTVVVFFGRSVRRDSLMGCFGRGMKGMSGILSVVFLYVVLYIFMVLFKVFKLVMSLVILFVMFCVVGGPVGRLKKVSNSVTNCKLMVYRALLVLTLTVVWLWVGEWKRFL